MEPAESVARVLRRGQQQPSAFPGPGWQGAQHQPLLHHHHAPRAFGGEASRKSRKCQPKKGRGPFLTFWFCRFGPFLVARKGSGCLEGEMRNRRNLRAGVHVMDQPNLPPASGFWWPSQQGTTVLGGGGRWISPNERLAQLTGGFP